jgi:hypothetical protein
MLLNTGSGKRIELYLVQEKNFFIVFPPSSVLIIEKKICDIVRVPNI